MTYLWLGKAADPSATPAEVMAELAGGATLFIDTFRKTSSVDLKAVDGRAGQRADWRKTAPSSALQRAWPDVRRPG